MNAADIGGGAGNAVTLNQNLNQHQFHPVRDATEAYSAVKAAPMIGRVIGAAARIAPLLLA